MTERNFPAEIGCLDDVNDFLDQEFEQNGIPLKLAMQLKIAMEEIFVNIAHYGYPGKKGNVKINLEIDNDGVLLRFTDSGIPFDPLAKPDPDVTLPAEDRPIGGLGIFMVKKSMDRVDYEYKNSNNILTIYKKR